ncbi:MAG: HypC/HybG/HupF family hydrogenase formation chaperone [Thermaerobacter sp.]|nr:HypC/HybG/HupF family hydrogenase formation chaperone [Thermaerobacter sp.]
MCLAVPVRIVRRVGDLAEVDAGGVRKEVSLLLVPEAAAGDYVLLHAGYAIQLVDEAGALETLDLMRRLVEAEETDGG